MSVLSSECVCVLSITVSECVCVEQCVCVLSITVSVCVGNATSITETCTHFLLLYSYRSRAPPLPPSPPLLLPLTSQRKDRK